METQDVLVVGSILLGCGCLGLLAVHMGTPVLRGLGWLAGAFAQLTQIDTVYQRSADQNEALP